MAINKYYTPKQSQYLPSTFDIYSNYYQQQGAAYEQGMTSIDSLYTELGKMKAFKPEDEERLYQRKKYYEDRLNGLIEASNGKPMQMMPGLRDINREFINDLSSGPLAEINSNYARAANDYATYQKKVGEGKWDSFTQLMAQESIGTGMVFPDSPDKMKIIRENVNDQLANNMDFNSLTSVVAQTLLSDPSVMQQGQMMASLFGTDSDYYKEWESNLMTTATSGALAKYKYSDKLEERFDQLIDTEHVKGISAEELEFKAKLAAETALLEHSDYRQSLAQLAGPNGDKILEQYDKTAYDMALRVARIKWTEANDNSGASGLSDEDIYNQTEYDVTGSSVFPNKSTGYHYRDHNIILRQDQLNRFAEDYGLPKVPADPNQPYQDENGVVHYPSPQGAWKDKPMSDTEKYYKYFNQYPRQQLVSYGLYPKVNGESLTDWGSDFLYDNKEKKLGNLSQKEMWIKKPDGTFKRTSGLDNYKEISDALGVEGDNPTDAFVKAMGTQSDPGSYHFMYWNGKENMYGVIVFNLLDKDNNTVEVAVPVNEAYSQAMRSQFGEISDIISKSDLQQRFDAENNPNGPVKYFGPGNYEARLENKIKITYLDEETKQEMPIEIRGIAVNDQIQKDNGIVQTDEKGNPIIKTKIKLLGYKPGTDELVKDDDLTLNGYDEFMNFMFGNYLKTQTKETRRAMFNEKPTRITGYNPKK